MYDSSVRGILTGDEILKYELIVDGDAKKCKKRCSWDLRLGDTHFVADKAGEWTAYYIGNSYHEREDSDSLPIQLETKLTIPPFGSAIVELKETINTLNVFVKYGLLVVGRFDLKLKAIYDGVISQQATQVEPCYYGKLYCFIYNLTSQSISFQPGESLATIEFSRSDFVVESNRSELVREAIADTSNKYNNSYSYKISDIESSDRITQLSESENFESQGCGIKDVRWFKYLNRLPAECGLTPIYNKINGQFEETLSNYLEKSSTIDDLSNRVKSRFQAQQNVLKFLIVLIVAAISYFGISYIVEAETELRYLEEEVEVMKEDASSMPYRSEGDSGGAIKSDHIQDLTNARKLQICLNTGVLIIFIMVIFAYHISNNGVHKAEKCDSKESLYAKEKMISSKK